MICQLTQMRNAWNSVKNTTEEGATISSKEKAEVDRSYENPKKIAVFKATKTLG